MLFYLRLALTLLWLIFLSCFGLIFVLISWKNPKANSWFGRCFGWGTLKIMNVKVIYEGRENLSRACPMIIVANHQSGLDMATLGALYPENTYLIGKKEIVWIPLFGLFYVAAGNLRIDRKHKQKAVAGLNAAVDFIRRKKASIWIFPEGTRNSAGDTLLPFKKGAFHMALQANVPIVPIVSGPLSRVFDWKKKQCDGGVLGARVLPPFYPSHYGEEKMSEFVKDVKDAMEKAFQELA